MGRMMNRHLGLVGAAALMAGCSSAPDGTGPLPSACTRDFVPVCGQAGPDKQSFINACVARAVGYAIIAQGECSEGGKIPGR